MRKLTSWDEFVKVTSRLGYTALKPGNRGGSGMPFLAPDGVTQRNFHKPHNGVELRIKTMSRRLGISVQEFQELAQ